MAHDYVCNNISESEKHYTETSQTQKSISYMIPFVWRSSTDKPNAWLQKSERWLPGVGRMGRVTVKGTQENLGKRGTEVFYIFIVRLVKRYMFVKIHWTVCLKWMYFIVYTSLSVHLKIRAVKLLLFCITFSSYFYPQNYQLQSPWITYENKVWLDYD